MHCDADTNATWSAAGALAGSLLVEGGASVRKDVQCANAIVNGTDAATSTSTGALRVAGGVGIQSALWCNSAHVTATQESSGPTVGALVVDGGVARWGGCRAMRSPHRSRRGQQRVHRGRRAGGHHRDRTRGPVYGRRTGQQRGGDGCAYRGRRSECGGTEPLLDVFLVVQVGHTAVCSVGKQRHGWDVCTPVGPSTAMRAPLPHGPPRVP